MLHLRNVPIRRHTTIGHGSSKTIHEPVHFPTIPLVPRLGTQTRHDPSTYTPDTPDTIHTLPLDLPFNSRSVFLYL